MNKKLLMGIVALLLLSSFGFAVLPTTNIDVYYSFDDGNFSGSTLYDLSGRNKDGVMHNSPTTGQPGFVNEGFYFDTNEYVRINHDLSPKTINFWVNKSDWDGGASTITFDYFYDCDEQDAERTLILLRDNGSLEFQVRSGGQGGANLGTQLQPYDYGIENNTFNMLTLTANGANTDVYINGIYAKSIATFMPSFDYSNSRFSCRIGTKINNDAANAFAVIDEFAIWQTTGLNSAEILELYLEGTDYNPNDETRTELQKAKMWLDVNEQIQNFTSNGAPLGDTGKLNGSFDFDGVTDSFDLTEDISTQIKSGTLSINTWAKSEDIATATHNSVWGFSDGTSNRCYLRYRASEGAQGNLYCVVNGAAQTSSNFVTGLDTDWHMITTVFDNGNLYIYYDGSIVVNETYKDLGNLVGSPSFTIGGDSRGFAPFDGDIDDFSIYEDVLTANEISNMYNSGSGSVATSVVTSSLLVYSSMDGGYDWSGYMHHATFNNGAGFGNYGNEPSFFLDGTNDYISTGDKFDYTERTYSTWVKRGSSSGSADFIFASRNAGQGIDLLQDNGDVAGVIRIGISTTTAYYFDSYSSGITATDEWHHYLVTYDETSNLGKLYIDGINVKNVTTSGTVTDEYNLDIGRRTASNYYNGQINNFGVYSKVLNSTEISTLADSQYNPYIVSSTPSDTFFTVNVNNTDNFNVTMNDYYESLCYQETANISTACGGLDNGNYSTSVQSLGSLRWYVNFNIEYSKPNSALNSSIWTVKHGFSSNSTYNISLPDQCWDAYSDKVMLRIRSRVGSGFGSEAGTQPFCHNGASYIPIGVNISGGAGGDSGSFNDFPNLIDGDWSTKAKGNPNPSFWQDNDDVAGNIYEEAMVWNLSSPKIKTQFNFSTSSGILITNVSNDNSSLWEIILSSNGYALKEFSEYNVSTNITTNLLDNETINNFTFVSLNSGNGLENTTINVTLPISGEQSYTTDENGTIFINAVNGNIAEEGKYVFTIYSIPGFVSPSIFTETFNQSQFPLNYTFNVTEFNVTINITEPPYDEFVTTKLILLNYTAEIDNPDGIYIDECTYSDDRGGFISTVIVNSSNTSLTVKYEGVDISLYPDGFVNMTINCSTTNTTLFPEYSIYLIDTTAPVIGLNPTGNNFALTNDSVLSKQLYDLLYNVTFSDDHLFAARTTIDCNTSGQIYNWNETDINTTTYDKSDSIDLSTYPLQACEISFWASDDHTAKYIPKYSVVESKPQLLFKTENNIEVTVIADDADIADVDNTKLKDRHSFKFDYDKKNLTRKYTLKSDMPLIYREDSEYPAHFIAWDAENMKGNWIDFDSRLPNTDYVVTKISDYEYKIKVKRNVPADYVVEPRLKGPLSWIGIGEDMTEDEIILEDFGLQDVTFNSIGDLNEFELNATFYIGGVLNITGINNYDDASMVDVNITVNGTNGAITKTYNREIDSSSILIENISSGNFSYNTTSTYYFSQEADFVITNDTTYLEIRSHQAEMSLSAINVKTLANVYNMTYNITDINGFSQQVYSNNSVYVSAYLNATNYSITAINDNYIDTTQNFSLAYLENTSYEFILPFNAVFTIYDEETGLIFDVASADEITFVLICNDSVFFTNVTSSNQSVPVTCDYQKFTFRVTYGADTYFRTLIVSPDEFQEVDTYLVNLDNANVVLVKFAVDDLYNQFEDISIYVTSTILNNTVTIHSDYVDFDNSMASYLLQNQQYNLEIYSSNNPVYLPGTYTANFAETKFIRVYQVGTEATPDSETIRNSAAYIDENNDTYVYAIYNDTTEVNEEVTFKIYKDSLAGTLLYTQTVNSSSAILLYNATAYENYTLVVQIYDGDAWTKTVLSDNSLDNNPLSNLDSDWVNWLITTILSIFAAYAISRNANLMSLVLVIGAGALVMFGMYGISWTVLGLSGIIALSQLLLRGQGQR